MTFMIKTYMYNLKQIEVTVGFIVLAMKHIAQVLYSHIYENALLLGYLAQ